MSRSALWTVISLVVLVFAGMMIFFWVRDGSLEDAGASMDETLSAAGETVATATGDAVDAASDAIDRATDGREGN